MEIRVSVVAIGRRVSVGPRVRHVGSDAMLLFPGAGGDAAHRTLVALERGLGDVVVARRDFPYRKKRKGPPDRAPRLIEAVRAEARELRDAGVTRLFLGGRSMGGRMCSMAVAEGLRADGLVLLSYPLHPPGKPDRLRTAHFPDIGVPCLFVSGTRDPFGTPEELEAAVAKIPAPVRIEWLDGERHDPRDRDDAILESVAAWLSDLGPRPRR